MNEPVYKNKYISKCCKFEVVVRGDSFGEGTNHYECLKCHKPCDWVIETDPDEPVNKNNEVPFIAIGNCEPIPDNLMDKFNEIFPNVRRLKMPVERNSKNTRSTGEPVNKQLDTILETLAAEAFIFGNIGLRRAVDMELPDNNHDLPPVDKAKQSILALIASEKYKAYKQGVEDEYGNWRRKLVMT